MLKVTLIVLFSLVFLFLLIFLYSCCVISSKYSRLEEMHESYELINWNLKMFSKQKKYKNNDWKEKYEKMLWTREMR